MKYDRVLIYPVLFFILALLFGFGGVAFCQDEGEDPGPLLEEAAKQISGGEMDRAGETLEKAENQFPGNEKVMEAFAGYLFKKGDYEKAAEKYKGLSEKDTANVNFRLKLSRCYHLLKKHDLVITALNGVKIESLDRDQAEFFLMLGEAWYSQKNNDTAVVFLNKALKADPDQLSARVLLGRIYQQKKLDRLAMAQYEAALGHRNADSRIKSEVQGLVDGMNQQFMREKMIFLIVPVSVIFIIAVAFIILKKQRERYGEKYEEEEEVEDFYG